MQINETRKNIFTVNQNNENEKEQPRWKGAEKGELDGMNGLEKQD